MAEAYIVAAARTAGGRKGGRLAGWHPADLAASVLDSLVERSGAAPDQIEDVIMGCVMQAGEQSNNVARNAIMASKLPESVPGTSVDRQCGSSQQALHFAAQAVMSGTMDIVIAAGVESMTRVPMGTPSVLAAKAGLGTYKSPGIEKHYPNIVFSQFTGAEMMAEKYGLSKDELDEYSYNSHQRAIAATQAGKFKDEIIPLQITRADGSTDTHSVDEGIRFDATLEGIRGVARHQADGTGASHDHDRRRSRDHAGCAIARYRTRAEEGRHVDRRHGPVRGQRGFCVGADRVAEDHGRRSGTAQRQRRRHRARPSARRLRHQADDHADQRAEAAQQALRPADHVRRRRHGECDDCGKVVGRMANSE
jgi:acetyl-CoA acetyltransferase